MPLLLAFAACDGDGVTNPDGLRFGQLGRIEVRLEAPLRFGAGTMTQHLSWRSSGPWSFTESISYKGVVGDEAAHGSVGDPARYAAAYDVVIRDLNETPGVRLFVDQLSPALDPVCGTTQSRVTVTLRDDARADSVTWIRCADGSFGNLTTEGAGPDPAASRIALATQLVRDATVSTLPERERYAYAGSVPFGTLDRGDDTRAVLRSPEAITDEEAWAQFWARHAAPTRPRPDVDFDHDMVIVGAFGVRDEAGDSVEVRRILQVDVGTLAEIYERVPGNFCSPAARPHLPFHIVVAPKTPVPIRFAELDPELVSCGG